MEDLGVLNFVLLRVFEERAMGGEELSLNGGEIRGKENLLKFLDNAVELVVFGSGCLGRDSELEVREVEIEVKRGWRRVWFHNLNDNDNR